jgi:hypothetical protein
VIWKGFCRQKPKKNLDQPKNVIEVDNLYSKQWGSMKHRQRIACQIDHIHCLQFKIIVANRSSLAPKNCTPPKKMKIKLGMNVWVECYDINILHVCMCSWKLSHKLPFNSHLTHLRNVNCHNS